MHAVFAFTRRNVRNRGFLHCGNTEQSSVLACNFRDVRDVIVVRIVDGCRVSVCRSDLVELYGLITCGVRGIGQVTKLLAARAEVRLTRAFGSGTVRQGSSRQERSVEVTVREQQGRRMKHENGEGEMEKCDMARCKRFEPCADAMSVRHARKMRQKNVRATRSLCTQFEGCVAEPLRTITAILPGSKWSCLLLRIVLQER